MPPKSVVLGPPPARKSGSRVSLACTAEDSNPKTTLAWLKAGKPMHQAGKPWGGAMLIKVSYACELNGY